MKGHLRVVSLLKLTKRGVFVEKFVKIATIVAFVMMTIAGCCGDTQYAESDVVIAEPDSEPEVQLEPEPQPDVQPEPEPDPEVCGPRELGLDQDSDGVGDGSDLYYCCFDQDELTYGEFALHLFQFVQENLVGHPSWFHGECSTPAEQVFDDVSPDSDLFEVAYCLHDWGLTWGPSSFQPNRGMQRQEIAFWLVQAFDIPFDGELSSGFDDVELALQEASFDAAMVARAEALGLFPEGSQHFGINEPATQCILDVFDRACEVGLCDACFETEDLPEADSDRDGVVNRDDDYDCCRGVHVKRLELASVVYHFIQDHRTDEFSECPGMDAPVILDVPFGSVGWEAVVCVVDWGLMGLFDDGFFHPEGEVSRAETAKVLASTLGLRLRPCTGSSDLCVGFEDVSELEWYWLHLFALVRNQLITDSHEARIFRPAEPTTFCLVDGILNACLESPSCPGDNPP